MKMLAYILAVGVSAIFLPWWCPLVLGLALLAAYNEVKIHRNHKRYEAEWRLREDLYRMGQRR